MLLVCFRCDAPLGVPSNEEGESHGVCIPCAREWMAAVGVCPAGPLTAAAAARCRARCPVAGECERLARLYPKATAEPERPSA